MRRALIVFASGILTACGSVAEEGSSPTPGAPGSYSRALPDGTPVTVVIREDGSLLRKVGDTVGIGTARTTGDQICFEFADDNGKEYCWTNGPIQADGTFESTGPEGEKLVIAYSPEMPPLGAKMVPGLYTVGDGTQVYARTLLRENGTYSDMTEAREVVGGGTWEQRQELSCFDPEGDGEDQQERCWINTVPASDGSFITTRDDASESYTVTPIIE